MVYLHKSSAKYFFLTYVQHMTMSASRPTKEKDEVDIRGTERKDIKVNVDLCLHSEVPCISVLPTNCFDRSKHSQFKLTGGDRHKNKKTNKKQTKKTSSCMMSDDKR